MAQAPAQPKSRGGGGAGVWGTAVPPRERFVGDQPDLVRADLHRPKLLGVGLVHDDRIDQAEVA